MNLEIILVGILVGIANFASRFGPFYFIQKFQQGSQKRGALWIKIALGLSDLYSSLWFQILVLMLGASIIIA